MKVAELAAIVKILSKISNQSSLTALYRSIELDKDTIRCCSEFGNATIVCSDTGLTKPALLDTSSVLGIAQSLTPESEIIFTEGTNKLEWKSDQAKGHLNLVFSEHKIPDLDHAHHPWVPDKSFAVALDLAASACQAAAVSVGLYGIAMEPVNDELYFLSSNSISLACSHIPRGAYPSGKATMRPPVPGIVATLVSTCPNCSIDITDDGIFIQGDWLKAHLPLASALEHDLKDLVDRFQSKEQTAKINGEAVRRFITRARALSDRNAQFTITMRIEQGKLYLNHSGIASSTEEFFIAENLDPALSYASVPFSAEMLLVSLGHVDTACFDYLSTKNLVFRGETPSFIYIVGGSES